MTSEADTRTEAAKALGLTKEYHLRFMYTTRREYLADIDAIDDEDAARIARELAETIDDKYGVEGDEVAFIYQVDFENEEDIEVDCRTPGEPYSWNACAFVKELAALDPAACSDKTIEKYIVAARGLLKEEDAVSPDSEAVP